MHIAQLARELAEEGGVAENIEASETGIGFLCATQPTDSETVFAATVLALLHALSGAPAPVVNKNHVRLEQLASILQGHSGSMPRLSDTGLVKLFRLLRLTRRLVDLQTQRPNDHQERST